jgi:hypothetical protein
MGEPADAVVDPLAEQALIAHWSGDQGSEAPPGFLVGSALAVPLLSNGLDLTIDVNVAQRVAIGRGRLRFVLPQAGRPLLDLVPRPTRLSIDGVDVPPERLRLVVPPDDATPLRMLDEALPAGVEHELDIEYRLGDDTVQFSTAGTQIGFFMTDLNQRGYLERHAPANLEFDQSPMTIELNLTGGGDVHHLFTNGKVINESSTTWRVALPDYFTCSSPFVHLTNRPVSVRTSVFSGAERQIPLTAYGMDVGEIQSALQEARDVLQELEDTYGPYAHEALLIYCTGQVSGGMEYAGATMTSLAALGHEITHSWFARGVMPANGNAGWIDEAIARWRDLGYPRAAAITPRPPVHLAGFSPYRRHTPRESYELGSLLLSELDLMLAPTGLRPVLRELFQQRRRQLITTQAFQDLLEQHTGDSLSAMFDRLVYGKGGEEDGDHQESLSTPAPPPHGFTPAQLRSLM